MKDPPGAFLHVSVCSLSFILQHPRFIHDYGSPSDSDSVGFIFPRGRPQWLDTT